MGGLVIVLVALSARGHLATAIGTTILLSLQLANARFQKRESVGVGQQYLIRRTIG